MDRSLNPHTIRDLAARLGVSSMTVHRAITGKPDVSAKTRSRILAEVERLGWQPNIAARGLRKGKTFTLGVVVPNTVESFLPEILQGVNEAAEERGYHTFVCVHGNEPARAERHLAVLQAKGVDGIVYYPTTCGDEAELLNRLLEATPVVVLLRELPRFRGSQLLVDDVLGGELGARHLIAFGHTRIGFLGFEDSGFTQQRLRGAERALQDTGLALRPEWCVTSLGTQDGPIRQQAARMLSTEERPTGLLCGSDRIAALVIQAAAEHGLRVPDDLSVVGYNDDAWAPVLERPLTTVGQPKREVGRLAAERVLPVADSESGEVNDADVALGAERFEPWLAQRRTTGPASGLRELWL